MKMANGRKLIVPELEPRVSKLEASTEAIQRDMLEVKNTQHEQGVLLRDLGSNMETQFGKLSVAITAAASPRRPEWSTLIMGVGLILTIGSLVFVPLNWRMAQFERNNDKQDALVEKELSKLDTKVQNEFTLAIATIKEMVVSLDNRLQLEYQTAADNTLRQTDALRDEVRLLNERNSGRLSKLEDWNQQLTLDQIRELSGRRLQDDCRKGAP